MKKITVHSNMGTIQSNQDDSYQGIEAGPCLGVDGVSIERATVCAPLRSIGITLFLHYYENIRLPMNRWASFRCTGCAALPLR